MYRVCRSVTTIGLIVLLSGLGVPLAFGTDAMFPARHQGAQGPAFFASLLTVEDADLELVPDSGTVPGGSAPEDGLTGGASIQVGPNVRVNALQRGAPFGLFGRSETTIAAARSDEDGVQLVAGYNFADGFLRPPFRTVNPLPGTPGLSGFAFSRDGGATWTDGGAPPVFNNIVTRGDPWLDVGPVGGEEEGSNRYFYANLSVDLRLPASQFPLGVSVHRGRFTRTGFVWDDVRLLQAPNYPRDFYDKEAIAIGKGANRRRGIVTLSNFIELCGGPANGNGQIEAWRTTDGGNTWHGPVIVSPDITFDLNPRSPTCGEGAQQQASSPAFGPRGEVYVVWETGPNFDAAGNATTTDAAIFVARSFTGGQTFDAPVKVATINSMFHNPPVGYNRFFLIDHPRIAVNMSEDHRGRIYVAFYSALAPATQAPRVSCPPPPPVFTNCRGQSMISAQVFLSFSDDRGVSWSTPKAIAPAIPGTFKRIFPVVMTGEDGMVSVFYYQIRETTLATPCNVSIGGGARRVGSASSLADAFVVVSRNGGATFSAPARVSTVTTNWCTTLSNIRPNFGDYLGSTSLGNRIFPVWADGRNGVPDTFFAPVRVTEPED